MNRACTSLYRFLEFWLVCKLRVPTSRGDKGMISRRPHVSSEAPGPGCDRRTNESPSYRGLTASLRLWSLRLWSLRPWRIVVRGSLVG